MLVSVDNIHEALFLTNASTNKVVEVLTRYIAQDGIFQMMRNDLRTAIKSKKSATLYKV